MRDMALIKDAEDVLRFAYDLNDFCIHDIDHTECMRFAVDPVEYYGITSQEADALREANAFLDGRRESCDSILARLEAEGLPRFGVTVLVKGKSPVYTDLVWAGNEWDARKVAMLFYPFALAGDFVDYEVSPLNELGLIIETDSATG